MSTVLEVLVIVVSILSGLLVAGLFVWAAFKDGAENDDVHAQLARRRPGRAR